MINVGDEFNFPRSFSDGFIRSVGKRMEGRTAHVKRIYSVFGINGEVSKVEFVFMAPTIRHKPFIFSMDMDKALKALEMCK